MLNKNKNPIKTQKQMNKQKIKYWNKQKSQYRAYNVQKIANLNLGHSKQDLF